MTETEPKRRSFRFSLRTLFILVTIADVAAGWVERQLNSISPAPCVFAGARQKPSLQRHEAGALVAPCFR